MPRNHTLTLKKYRRYLVLLWAHDSGSEMNAQEIQELGDLEAELGIARTDRAQQWVDNQIKLGRTNVPTYLYRAENGQGGMKDEG